MDISADDLRDILLHSPTDLESDYPPYALTSWDDRNRFNKWVLSCIDMLEERRRKLTTETKIINLRAFTQAEMDALNTLPKPHEEFPEVQRCGALLPAFIDRFCELAKGHEGRHRGVVPCTDPPFRAAKPVQATAGDVAGPEGGFISNGRCLCGHLFPEHKETMPGKFLCMACAQDSDNVIGCEQFRLDANAI